MSQLHDIAKNCLSCPLPKCEQSCPCGNHIRDFILAVKNGEEEKAASILYGVNPFPELTSLLCDHARQCYGHCIKNRMGAPVPVYEIEYGLSQAYPRPLEKEAANGRKVAIVGAGPAGLSAAYFLAKRGYEVDVYERDSSCGGAIGHGIPAFRFDHEKLRKIQSDLEKMGICFHFNTTIGKDVDLSTIQAESDAVLLCVGAEKENKAFLSDAPGIEGGLSYLSGYDGKKKDDKECFVWGGGNVAIDCARTLLREHGKATIIYRRSQAAMPASVKEIEEALSEGVELWELTNIVATKMEDGRLSGLTLVKMELGEPDESGRPSFHQIPDSEFFVKADLLVYALGEKPDLSLFPGLETKEDLSTNIRGLYCAGDAHLGAKNIATAIAEGRKAAERIATDLEG